MGAMLESFFGQPHVVAIFQILLDISLILCLYFFFSRRPKAFDRIEELTRSLGKVIEETQGISEDFDNNLKERQRLIQQIILKLDTRLHEAQLLCQKLEALQRDAAACLQTQAQAPLLSENQEILRLARKGFNAAAIAQRLQKPVGEVELILSLQRISPDR